MRIWCILAVLVTGQWVFAAPSQEGSHKSLPPSELLKEKLDAVIAVLENKKLDQHARNEQILEIVTPVFDFDVMAMLALGKKHWTHMTPEQRREYNDLFVDRLKVSYSEKLALYTDQKVVFKEPLTEDKKVYVPTELLNGEETISILYKFRRVKKGWMVYDVEIQGVSIIKTYYAQFNEILKNGTVDDLLRKLKEGPLESEESKAD
jgi:phospholipid transport system substrate-binding protein